jgi:Ni,Fe-hydrogenase III large subunit
MKEKAQIVNPILYVLPDLMELTDFLNGIRNLCLAGYFPLSFFGTARQEMLCGMAMAGKEPILLRCLFPQDMQYQSLSMEFPAFHLFERELWEEFGIKPLGHPWLKPVRFPLGSQQGMEHYPFFSSESSAHHEVGVGPVHAGVIEPGHFRFICHGERIEHLEIQLGYQHRGIMSLIAQGDIRQKMPLAESIAGDTAIGHGLAYCSAVESLCNVSVPPALQTVRLVALELERIAMHLADLSALAGDIAYLSGQNFFAALRTTIINSSLAICGSRFGKRWLKPGGINYGISKEQNSILRSTLEEAGCQIERCTRAMFADAGVLNRFDSTGSISKKAAIELNFSGVTAKASGLGIDARCDFPLIGYDEFNPLILDTGDVFARASIRAKEIEQSLDMIAHMLSTLPSVSAEDSVPLPPPIPDKLCIAITEGWRGRIVHVLKTDSEGGTEFYRVIDPSLHNWFALALAVRNEGISDFPLCNKSFDLSYCGTDL